MKEKIVFTSTDTLDQYEFQAEEFLREMFDLEGGMFTDLTEISDFCGRGLTTEQMDSTDSYNALCTLWDAYIIDRIKQRYGIELDRTNILLTEVLEQIQSKKPTFKH
jgi:hypothetical protein